MTNRKILYGYQIQRGELVVRPQEAVVAKRIVTLYMDGLSYQKIADALNADDIPFSEEAPLWNKHKVKRLLENPRYTGVDGSIRDRASGLAMYCRPPIMSRNMPAVGLKVQKGSFR